MEKQQSDHSSQRLEEGLKQILNPHDSSGHKPPGASSEYPRKTTEAPKKSVVKRKKLPRSAEVIIRIAAGLLALGLLTLFALQISQ